MTTTSVTTTYHIHQISVANITTLYNLSAQLSIFTGFHNRKCALITFINACLRQLNPVLPYFGFRTGRSSTCQWMVFLNSLIEVMLTYFYSLNFNWFPSVILNGTGIMLSFRLWKKKTIVTETCWRHKFTVRHMCLTQ